MTLNATLNAMTDLLKIISDPETVQTVNDGKLEDATAPYAAANPGKAVGQQARYYEAVQTRLNAGRADPEAPVAAVPFKPRTPA